MWAVWGGGEGGRERRAGGVQWGRPPGPGRRVAEGGKKGRARAPALAVPRPSRRSRLCPGDVIQVGVGSYLEAWRGAARWCLADEWREGAGALAFPSIHPPNPAPQPACSMFCQATGFGGTVQQGETVEEKLRARRAARAAAVAEAEARAAGGGPPAPPPPPPRELTVTFNADVAHGLPWSFTPAQRAVRVRPGQAALAFFVARNHSARPVSGEWRGVGRGVGRGLGR